LSCRCHLFKFFDCTVISFYPEDIRAYATAYWAAAKFDDSFLGSRCDDSADLNNAAFKDNATGLWDEYHCFTLNPASLLIVLGNQVGIRGKSFIYDRGMTGQVWNQPVVGYQINYFNPLNSDTYEFSAYNASKISFTTFLQNANTSVYISYYTKKANPATKQVVGISLTVTYVSENGPVFGDRVEDDNISTASYKFIVELDDSENIIGGEWTSNDHPMFLWNLAQGASPFGYGDNTVKTFNGTVEELKKMTSTAQKVSNAQNTVLGAVMRYLVQESSVNSTTTTSTTLAYLE